MTLSKWPQGEQHLIYRSWHQDGFRLVFCHRKKKLSFFINKKRWRGSSLPCQGVQWPRETCRNRLNSRNFQRQPARWRTSRMLSRGWGKWSLSWVSFDSSPEGRCSSSVDRGGNSWSEGHGFDPRARSLLVGLVSV